MRRDEIELLAPAGSYEGFEAAIGAGADAVYVGGAAFGARAYAKNFGEEELLRAIDTAHIHGNRPGLITLSVIITYLRILFAKINSHDQITNFVHLFLPVSGQSVPALLSRSQTSSSHTVPGEDTSSPVKTLLSFY